MFLLVSLSNFSLVSHSYRSCSNRVALVSLVQYSCRSCLTRVALASLMSRSCRIHVARVWRSCCKLDYINSLQLKYHAFHIYHPSFNLLGGLMLQNQLKSISLLRGFSLRILTGKKHPKIKFQCLRKIRILTTFGLLVHQINSFKDVIKLEKFFQKNYVVTGKITPFVIGPFCSSHSICLNIGF